MNIKGHEVKGIDVDAQTRCKHYPKEVDRIALKFKCCDTYYPCYQCHDEIADHKAETWTVEERNKKAVLCGSCGMELTINEYMNSGYACPHCEASFNPGCRNHAHLYFDVSED
ncbi:CHY zinc finger protein [Pontibacillus yanchengensis]|uniref:CHY-type domain-containing protein n=1 Tax=Pontibacillus yanchengensis Y32 TaxID=1385514 RepID=A0A0A2TXT9_9BACI|nr:CHY zinc finger protein [Pontibacillus yanchengensis]KGP74090.1 hypothetical protein N782_17310 [Pontibacillus yanchengensis Y32]